jgi:hypothetical protein
MGIVFWTGDTQRSASDWIIMEVPVDDIFSLVDGKDSFEFKYGTLYKFVRNCD